MVTLLYVKNLKKSFGAKLAVDDIDLQISRGQLIALLGPNGAGKSTVISMLIGIMKPDSGEIRLEEMSPQESHYHRRIGVVFQSSVLDGQLTVRQNLNLRAGMYRDIGSERVSEVLSQFSLTKIADQKYKTLSGGQRRRVDIARAVLHHPDLLFLDEPSTGLDVQTRRMIWMILDRLRREDRLTIVLTTHYLEEAETADFVYVLDYGKIIAADTVQKLKKAYAPTRLLISTLYPKRLQSQFPKDWRVAVTSTGLSIAVPDAISCIPIHSRLESSIDDFELRKGTVDDICLTLTGKEMR